MNEARIQNATYIRSTDLEGLEAITLEGFQGERAYYARREFLFIFSEGQGTRDLTYRGEQQRVSSAELVVIQAGEPYTVRVARPLTGKLVSIDISLFRKTAGLEEGRVARLPYFAELSPGDAQLAKLVAKLHRAVTEKASLQERQRLLQDVVERAVSRHTAQRPAARRGTRKVQMTIARDHMQESLSRNIPLKELAKMTDMSVFQFVRTFAKEIGLTPHALLIHMRVQKARELLRRGVSATEASEQAGFADPSHLVRHFKRVFKVTPGTYASSSVDRQRS